MVISNNLFFLLSQLLPSLPKIVAVAPRGSALASLHLSSAQWPEGSQSKCRTHHVATPVTNLPMASILTVEKTVQPL